MRGDDLSVAVVRAAGRVGVELPADFLWEVTDYKHPAVWGALFSHMMDGDKFCNSARYLCDSIDHTGPEPWPEAVARFFVEWCSMKGDSPVITAGLPRPLADALKAEASHQLRMRVGANLAANWDTLTAEQLDALSTVLDEIEAGR